jgi:hypothetical protein
VILITLVSASPAPVVVAVAPVWCESLLLVLLPQEKHTVFLSIVKQIQALLED